MKLRRLILCALLVIPLFLSGCFMDTILGDIVNRAPRAVIDAAPESGPAPLTVAFDAHFSHDDDGSIAEYHWDFGDPHDRSFDRETTCAHTYVHAGTYLATLSVVDDEGMGDSQQIAIVVTNAEPIATATVTNSNPLPGREVIFDATGSYDPGGSIVAYHWDFDDGTTADEQIASHTYIEGGYYSVTLTVTDDEGATAVARLGVDVQPGTSDCGDDSSCGDGSSAPFAVIMGMPSCGGAEVGAPIHFDGTASRAGDAAGKITSYYWDLGDGTTSTQAAVTHTYTSVNPLVVVTLTVTNDLGESSAAYATFPVKAQTTCP